MSQDICRAVKEAIEAGVPDSRAAVNGANGHYTVEVESPAFAGKNRIQAQRLVYATFAHLMAGENAPVHAVDKLTTRVP